jgi:hypothetical protein
LALELKWHCNQNGVGIRIGSRIDVANRIGIDIDIGIGIGIGMQSKFQFQCHFRKDIKIDGIKMEMETTSH